MASPETNEHELAVANALARAHVTLDQVRRMRDMGYTVRLIPEALLAILAIGDSARPQCFASHGAWVKAAWKWENFGPTFATWEVQAPNKAKLGKSAGVPGTIWKFCDQHMRECIVRHLEIGS